MIGNGRGGFGLDGRACTNIVIDGNRFENSSLWDGKCVITASSMKTVHIQGDMLRRIERGSGIRVGAAAKGINVTNNSFERNGNGLSL
jgi:hypothetical protein